MKLRLRWRMLPLAIAALLLAAGMVKFFLLLIEDGADWAMHPWNPTAYSDGCLSLGTVTDRDGTVLTCAGSDGRFWAEDWTTRVSTLHAVGDPYGYIGTGALSAYPEKLAGYSLANGLYSADTGGGTVTLSIDADLCNAAWDALDGRRGAVLVTNYETGEILCMVSSPSYDPADSEAWIEDGAYLNRCLSGLYPPGSVFKIITAAAALDTVPDILEQEFYCEESLTIGEDTVNCTGWHGSLMLEDAFASSCNCAFAEIALEVGGETLSEYAQKLGMCTGFSIDGIETAAGNFDAAEDGSVTLAWSGIGQSTDLVCPAALNRLVCAIARGGTAPDMTLLRDTSSAQSERILSASTAEMLGSMMSYAAVYSYGEENFPGLELHAKSGTAEVDGDSPHAWFTGYITNEGYPLAFTVIVENGGWGASTAGYVANEVLQRAVFG